MRNIKMILEYDGSPFFGFQSQPHHRTIQEVLEAALSQILNEKTKIQAASGRTDTGVHALHQVVNFRTNNKLSCRQLQNGLNALLPRDIAIIKLDEAPKNFHARFSARSKIYEYRIWNAPVRSPLQAKQAWHVPVKLDLKRIKKAILFLKGRFDFKAFTAAHGSAQSTIRKIYSFTIEKKGCLLVFKIEADGFLYHMVRNLIGTLVEVGKGRLNPQNIPAILASKDRKNAGPTAPAEGLTLAHVRYGKRLKRPVVLTP